MRSRCWPRAPAAADAAPLTGRSAWNTAVRRRGRSTRGCGWRGAPSPPAPAGGRVLDRLAPDIMHIHSPLTLGALAGKAARRRGIPVVYTNHYLPANARPSARPRPRGFDTMFYAYLVGFANRCTYVTAPTATALRLLRDRGLRVPSRAISNGVDLRAYRPGPP